MPHTFRNRYRIVLALSGSMIMLQPRTPASAVNAQAAPISDCAPATRIDVERFRSLMQMIADGWNRGDAARAASCFAEDAIYSGPPSPSRRGRKSLYEYFGGAKGRSLPMHMTWHNLVFDPAAQIGFGEYTFRYQIQTHGIVIIKLSNGLIRNWREYEVESNLPWDAFVGDNRF